MKNNILDFDTYKVVGHPINCDVCSASVKEFVLLWDTEKTVWVSSCKHCFHRDQLKSMLLYDE